MPSDYDLIIKKPVSALNSPAQIDFKAFFSSLTKALMAGSFGSYQNALEHGVDAVKEAGLKDSPENVAWTLISRSLMQALTTLTGDYRDLLDKKLDETAISDLAGRVEFKLNTVEVSVDARFFEQPKNLPLLDDFKPTLMIWLDKLGMDEFQAGSFHYRLKSQFALALHEEWGNHPDDYRCLAEQIDTPFTKAALEERSWQKYNAWLQGQANERVFGEAFGLQQVYIRLRAYYEQVETSEHGREKKQKMVCDLHDEIESWIKYFDANDSLRIVSGGPGSGKSSFAKVLAAELVEKQVFPVLFIPLHHFILSDDLIQAVANFTRHDLYFRGNPLDPQEGQKRLVMIFDGLDELSMQGKAAEETAQQFVDEVIRTLDRYNDNGGIKWQALITSRELPVQANTARLRKPRQILHALPYSFTQQEAGQYTDENELLITDQRNLWWQRFGQAKGKPYEGLPSELAIDHLQPITKEPLLNYLISLSYERGEIIFDESIRLNTIYYDLLEAVYERQYEDQPHTVSQKLSFEEFLRILEEIALAVWHGNGRTASTKYLVERCKENQLSHYLTKFSDDAKSGVVRLLTAFYFREFGKDDSGDRTFEFTHKSFGEYLTARRIVKEVASITKNIRRFKMFDGGYSQEEALVKWVKVCGSSAMDDYLLRFIKDEIAIQVEKNGLDMVKGWQSTFLDLLGFVVRKFSPMEKTGLASFAEMIRHSRNAEESLMSVHYSCALQTKEVLETNWGAPSGFGNWFRRTQGQHEGFDYNLTIFKVLGYLSFTGQILHLVDFWKAGLFKANFENAKLQAALFAQANLGSASLINAELIAANFTIANLTRANLEGANLAEAILKKAILQYANLEKAILQYANLEKAMLQHANLKGANLEGANLEGANLEGANLEGANLEGANLEGVRGKYKR